MCSTGGIQTSLWMGCPIGILRAHRLDAAPPERFAGLRVLHRPSAPRHPPRTLCSLLFYVLFWWSSASTRAALCSAKLKNLLSSVVHVQIGVDTPTTEEWKPESRWMQQHVQSCSTWDRVSAERLLFPRKEVIQPHLPVRLPCYDFTPITDPTLDACLPHGLAQRLQGLPTFVV